MLKVPSVMRIWILQALHPMLGKATRLAIQAEAHQKDAEWFINHTPTIYLPYSIAYHQRKAAQCRRGANWRFAFVRWVRHLIGDE